MACTHLTFKASNIALYDSSSHSLMNCRIPEMPMPIVAKQESRMCQLLPRRCLDLTGLSPLPFFSSPMYGCYRTQNTKYWFPGNPATFDDVLTSSTHPQYLHHHGPILFPFRWIRCFSVMLASLVQFVSMLVE